MFPFLSMSIPFADTGISLAAAGYSQQSLMRRPRDGVFRVMYQRMCAIGLTCCISIRHRYLHTTIQLIFSHASHVLVWILSQCKYTVYICLFITVDSYSFFLMLISCCWPLLPAASWKYHSDNPPPKEQNTTASLFGETSTFSIPNDSLHRPGTVISQSSQDVGWRLESEGVSRKTLEFFGLAEWPVRLRSWNCSKGKN